MPVQILTHKDKEAYTRLTAPQHIAVEHFSRHQKIEGYHENRDAPEFVGSDRLLKLDTLYGTIQMGYNPRRGQSFLFANIKTSVFDTAASRYQKELKEYQMARALKTGTQNLAYSAKRRGGAAVILYKAQNMPWSRGSIAPYLARANMEALRKTMPFLEQTAERAERQENYEKQRELKKKLDIYNPFEAAKLRAEQVALSSRQDELNSLIYREDTQMRSFFRKLNYAYNMQQEELLNYYRGRRPGSKPEERESVLPTPNDSESNDE